MKDIERALARLYRRNIHTVKLDLAPTRALLDEMGRPQDAFVSVHVAGTNGKGSVCAMIASVLRAAGLRVGLYTSPHLIRFNERIAVNGHSIGDIELAALLDDVDRAAAESSRKTGQRDVTFFEFTTGLAFAHFRRAGVQVAVVETGMGGRLDATNVLDPLVSVITSIGMDHSEFLGPTIEAIAAEKAGILKAGRPVVVGDLPEAAWTVVRDTAARVGSDVYLARDVASVTRKAQTPTGQRIRIETSDERYGPLTLPLLGAHQMANCAVAVSALERLRDAYGLPVTREAVARGLESVQWPARLQWVSQLPPTVVDGAHNEEAAQALARALAELAPARPLALVVSFLRDKDARRILAALAPGARAAWAVPLHNSRAMPLDEVMAAARSAGLDPQPASLQEALRSAQAWALQRDGVVCVTGSLYLAGEALRALSP